MRISQVFRMRRRIAVSLIVPLILWCVDASAYSMGPPQDEIKISIRTVEVNPDHIIITYELTAPAADEYQVSLVLLKEGSPSFRVPVRSASGDIGEGKFTGSRRVRWEFAKDYPSGLYGDGFYFEISVSRVTKSNLLLYLGLGGVAIVGGAVAILAGGKKSDGGGTPTTVELPQPPARPSQ